MMFKSPSNPVICRFARGKSSLGSTKSLTGQTGMDLSLGNPEKLTCGLFSRRRGIRADPDIKLKGVSIPLKKKHKFLGVVLDEKLTFIPHIKHLKQKCLKTMNILKVLSHCSYGADKQILLRVFTSLIGSRLDYGSVVYGSACKTAQKMLDPVLHLGLRLASGAFRTSPIEILYAECDRWSLEHQRSYASLLYAIKATSVKITHVALS